LARATYPEVVPELTRLGGQPLLTPPYLVLHREEFAWPRMSPHAPVRSYRTISPITRYGLVCFLLHLSSPGSKNRQTPRR